MVGPANAPLPSCNFVCIRTPGLIRTADHLVRRENQPFLGVYKSITCGACQSRTQSHQGTVMAHPVWVWHICDTEADLAAALLTESSGTHNFRGFGCESASNIDQQSALHGPSIQRVAVPVGAQIARLFKS